MKRTALISVALALALAVGFAFGAPLQPDAIALGLPFILGNTISPEEVKKLEETLSKKAGEVVETVQKLLKDEVEKLQTLTTKGNERMEEVAQEAKKAQEKLSEAMTRLTDVEQKMASKPGGADPKETKSPGQLFVESEAYKKADHFKCNRIEAVEVGAIHKKTAIINATGQNQPLVPDMRVPGIIMPAERRLTIRDLLPQLRTSSNLVQFASENVFTNNAGPQFNSPNDRENVTKNESGITFQLSNAAVVTIAHWIPASRQILSDAPGLQSYIDQRLLYGLKLEEEDQILNGDGTGGNLSGLRTQDTAYNRGVSNDTKLDCLLKAMLQVALSEYVASGIILNPIDWTTIRLLKDSQNRYLFGHPQETAAPRLWGLPVVATNSMSEGEFQVGAYDLAAAIWDREDASVRVAEQHDDFFVKNMVAILCEERMTLTVYRAAAIVGGTLPAAGT